MDQDDIFDVHRKIGDKFCLSGGIPNFILSYRSTDEVRACVKKVIEGVAKDGGYLLDASAIMQNDTGAENLKAMVDAAREYGIYSDGQSGSARTAAEVSPDLREGQGGHYGLERLPEPRTQPNVCVPWETKKSERPQITGDEDLIRTVWEQTDALGNMFIWQCLLSF